MKKVMLTGLIIFLGLSSQAFAKAGIAKDGLEFVLTLVGFLLIVAGIMEGIDYLMKNGKGLLIRFKAYLKKQIIIFRDSFGHFQ
jgi:hypothetical protein